MPIVTSQQAVPQVHRQKRQSVSQVNSEAQTEPADEMYALRKELRRQRKQLNGSKELPITESQLLDRSSAHLPQFRYDPSKLHSLFTSQTDNQTVARVTRSVALFTRSGREPSKMSSKDDIYASKCGSWRIIWQRKKNIYILVGIEPRSNYETPRRLEKY